MGTQNEFGQWMKQRRKQLDLTQEELAGLVSCSPVTIKKIESNQRRPSKQIAAGLAQALRVDSTEIEKFLAEARGVSPQEATTPSFFEMHISLPGMSLVQRPIEIATICNLLRRPDLRLLTLTGPGGVGKTRLAIQAAQETIREFRDGVYLVDLATLSRSELLLTTIAVSLGLAAPNERIALQVLSGYFQSRQSLLVLNNFEQILGAAPQLAAWMGTINGPKILVTSRARLRLSMEYEYAVPTLDLPNLGSLPTLSELLLNYPAVELFTLRVQALQPEFQLTHQNAQAVAEICTLLDGLPLAIELAAARCNLLDPQSLLERLKQFRPLRLLTGGAQDLPARQQTLQQTIDWSYSLLSDAERQLFERLSIFAGGAILEAIEAVCADNDDAMSILDNLQTLMDHSLIWRSVASAGNAPRFQMLVTLREYALERLTQRGELDLYRHKQAAYFEKLIIECIPGLRNAQQVVTTQRLEVELDNFRTVLEWCCSPTGDVELGMRLAGQLWEFWLMHGEIEEGAGWILRLLALFGHTEPTIWKAYLLNGLGILKNESGDNPLEYFNESLAIFRKMGDRYGEAWVLSHIAQVYIYSPEYPTDEKGSAYLEESLQLFQTLNAEWNTAWVLYSMACMNIDSKNLERAESLIQRSLRLFQQTGDQRGIAINYAFLSRLAQQQGNLPAAIKLLMDSVELLNQVRDINGVAWTNIALAALLVDRGDITDARVCLLKSLQLFRQKGNLNLGVARSLIGLSQAGLKSGMYEQALSMLAAASALLKQSEVYGEDFERGMYSSMEQEIRQHLGDEKYEQLWQEGQKDPIAIVNVIEKGGWNRRMFHHLRFNEKDSLNLDSGLPLLRN